MTNQVHLSRSDNPECTEYYDLYRQQINVDFTFTCANNELVKAHSIILMASSPFFYEEFKANRETLNCVLPQASAAAVRRFLELVYRRKVNGTSDAMNEVIHLANTFRVKYQEMEGEQVEPDTQDVKFEIGAKAMEIVDEPLISKTNITTELQCNDNVECDTSFEKDITLLNTSDVSEIIDVSEELPGNINNDVTNSTPPANHNIDQEVHQSAAEARYNHCLKTMNFARLSSSCILCMKFYSDIKRHLRKKHETAQRPKWHCEKCKSGFFWLKKTFHNCTNK